MGLEGAVCPAGALAEVSQQILTPGTCGGSASTLPFPAVSHLAAHTSVFSLPSLKLSL